MKGYRINRSGFVFCFVIGIFLLVSTNPALAADFCVGTTTQLNTALTTAASNGEDDVIKIQQGTYNGNFIYSASTEAYGVTIEGGYIAGCVSREVVAANTVLDAKNSGHVLVLSAPNVAANFVVDGLTIYNGNAGSSGGGLSIITNLGNAIINNNYFENNFSGDGAIYIYGTNTLTIENNEITNNQNARGLYISNCNIVKLVQNIVNQNAGGIRIESASQSVEMEKNVIINNSESQGGGAFIRGTNTVTLKGNTIEGNVGSSGGGGLWITSISSSVNLYGNIIRNNTGKSWGGGAWIGSWSEINLINNLITENHVLGNTGGGGLWVDIGFNNANIINNTITFNSSSSRAGGIFTGTNDNSDSLNFYNNIVINNEALTGKDIYLMNDANNDLFPSTVNLFYNDIDQSTVGIYLQIPFPIDPSNLNNVDPLFVDSANGDYHLTLGSSCIDAGDSSAPEIPLIDKDDNPRIVGTAVDIGAYEYQGYVVPVAAFIAEPVFGITPLNVQFTDQSSGSVEAWEWNFGDGSPVSNEINPFHTYNAPGLYTVSLKVSGDSEFDTETKEELITVISPGAPDLIGKTRAFHSLNFGRNISMNVQVENLGTEKACGFKVELWHSGDGYNLDELVDERNVIGCIKGGKSRNIGLRHFSDTSLSGSYVIYLIDSGNDVIEIDENNNRGVAAIP